MRDVMTFAQRWLSLGVLGVSMITAVNCSSRSNSQQAPVGTERGPCKMDGTCDAGLTCLSSVCVNASGAGGTPSSAGGTGAIGDPPMGGDTGTPAAGGTGGGGEPVAGGEAGSDGAAGAPTVPPEVECRTEESYLICAHAGLTWSQAQSYCESQGGDLVKIDDTDENTALTAAFTETGSAWIGANDIDAEGQFVWLDGSTVPLDAEPWAESQPNDNAEDGEDCAVLHSGAGEWNDVSCDLTSFGDEDISFICEVP
jgi:hypothetical protein